MRSLLVCSFVGLTLLAAETQAANIYGLKPGQPNLKSIGALAFGPDGILFVGDALAGSVVALETGDQASGGDAAVNFDVEGIGGRIAQQLHVAADSIEIRDLAVNPQTGHVFLGVSVKGEDPRIVKVDGSGAISEVSLKNIPFSRAELPNPAEDKLVQTRRGQRNNRENAITDVAFVDGQVIVSGMSSDEASSSVWSVLFPFSKVSTGAALEIYHGAHGQRENQAPIRTFVPFIINGEPNLLAGYVCTPLVKFPLKDVTTESRKQVTGTTVAELGNRNQPLDMITYKKDGKDYLLLSNSARGVMKISTDQIAQNPGITEPVRGGGTAGQQYETIGSLEGVVQLDRLNEQQAVVLIQSGDTLALKSIPLP